MEIPYTVKPRPDTGLYNGKLGIWLFLASEVMLFGALFSSYVLLRVGAADGTWSMGLMDVVVGAGNTMVLIASSMFVVLAWAQLKQGRLSGPWLSPRNWGYIQWKWASERRLFGKESEKAERKRSSAKWRLHGSGQDLKI